jgi:hypothetical protein
MWSAYMTQERTGQSFEFNLNRAEDSTVVPLKAAQSAAQDNTKTNIKLRCMAPILLKLNIKLMNKCVFGKKGSCELYFKCCRTKLIPKGRII